MPALRRWRFRLVVFLVRMCRRFILLRLNLPVPVTLKRFLAPEFDFILGMARLSRLGRPAILPGRGPKSRENVGVYSASGVFWTGRDGPAVTVRGPVGRFGPVGAGAGAPGPPAGAGAA